MMEFFGAVVQLLTNFVELVCHVLLSVIAVLSLLFWVHVLWAVLWALVSRAAGAP